jgi:hypothetical protein
MGVWGISADHAQKSILEEIIDVTLTKLDLSGKYSKSTIEKIREIAADGNLNRREPIIEAIENQLEEENETT